MPDARRETRRLRAAGRAGCAARRAGCTPEDVPLARRKTCRVRAVRDAQVRPAVRSGLSLLARVSQSSTVGPRGGRRHARRGPQEHRASPALPRALARRLSQSRGGGKLKFRRALRFSFFTVFLLRKEAERKRSTQRSKTRRFESQARARVQGGRLPLVTLSPSRNTHKQQQQQQAKHPGTTTPS